MEIKPMNKNVVSAVSFTADTIDNFNSGINSFMSTEKSAQNFLNSLHIIGALTMAAPPMGATILAFSFAAQMVLDKWAQNIKLNILIQEVLEGINYLLKMEIIQQIIAKEKLGETIESEMAKNIEKKIKFHLGGLISLLIPLISKNKGLCKIGNRINNFLNSESLSNEIINRLVLLNFFLTIELLRISSIQPKQTISQVQTQEQVYTINEPTILTSESKQVSDAGEIDDENNDLDGENNDLDDEFDSSRSSLTSIDDLEEDEKDYVQTNIQMGKEFNNLQNTYSAEAEQYLTEIIDKVKQQQTSYCSKMVSKIKKIFSNNSDEKQINPISPKPKKKSMFSSFTRSKSSSSLPGGKKTKRRKNKKKTVKKNKIKLSKKNKIKLSKKIKLRY